MWLNRFPSGFISPLKRNGMKYIRETFSLKFYYNEGIQKVVISFSNWWGMISESWSLDLHHDMRDCFIIWRWIIHRMKKWNTMSRSILFLSNEMGIFYVLRMRVCKSLNSMNALQFGKLFLSHFIKRGLVIYGEGQTCMIPLKLHAWILKPSVSFRIRLLVETLGADANAVGFFFWRQLSCNPKRTPLAAVQPLRPLEGGHDCTPMKEGEE